MLNSVDIWIQYWSCGCITHSSPEHDTHPIAFLIGVERRTIESTLPIVNIITKDPKE